MPTPLDRVAFLQVAGPFTAAIQGMGIAIERIHDGKIVEHWSNLDQLSLMQQLGVIPTL
jgi:predicted SnoaL-like aldol condensation-catalyzing enzyme